MPPPLSGGGHSFPPTIRFGGERNGQRIHLRSSAPSADSLRGHLGGHTGPSLGLVSVFPTKEFAFASICGSFVCFAGRGITQIVSGNRLNPPSVERRNPTACGGSSSFLRVRLLDHLTLPILPTAIWLLGKYVATILGGCAFLPAMSVGAAPALPHLCVQSHFMGSRG
jgi:hypothetical protein